MRPGRIWCICFRKEFNNNRRCPKAEAATGTKGMMRQTAKKPPNNTAFVKFR